MAYCLTENFLLTMARLRAESLSFNPFNVWSDSNFDPVLFRCPPLPEQDYPYVKTYRDLLAHPESNPHPFKILCGMITAPASKFHLYLDLVHALEPAIPDHKPIPAETHRDASAATDPSPKSAEILDTTKDT